MSHSAHFKLFALILVFSGVIVPVCILVSILDRKLGADLQARVGPSRGSWAGVLQPFADFLKLAQKKQKQAMFWTTLYSVTLLSTVAVLPLSSALLWVDTDISAFLPFFSALVVALVTLLLGLSQFTVSGWLGGMRIGAQALSASFPALVSLLCGAIQAGTFRWTGLAESQGWWPFLWTAFSSPFQFIAFIVFEVSGLILLGLPPMDASQSQTSLQGGILSGFSSFDFGLFRFGRWYSLFLWSVVAVVVFLGGWVLPPRILTALRDAEATKTILMFELTCLLLKTISLMLLVCWVARVNGRRRIDHITDFSWKILSPLALFALIGASVLAAWGKGA